VAQPAAVGARKALPVHARRRALAEGARHGAQEEGAPLRELSMSACGPGDAKGFRMLRVEVGSAFGVPAPRTLLSPSGLSMRAHAGVCKGKAAWCGVWRA